MSSTVEFAFAAFEQVCIVAIATPGFVHSRMNNATGVNEYKVMYWMDGKRTDDWFYEHELVRAEQQR